MIALSVFYTLQRHRRTQIRERNANEEEWKGEIGKNDKGDSLFDLM